MTDSNATDTGLASVLTELGGPDKGTLAFLTLKKKGTVKGKEGNKITYDDDVVQVLLWSGFSYRDLAARSYQKLHQIWGKGDLTTRLLKAVEAKGYSDITLQDASEVIQEVEDSFLKVTGGTAGDVPPGYEDTFGDEMTHHFWDPLKVNGQLVRGAKVYVGPGDASDPHAPVPGSIYIDGVKLGEKVLQVAPNGHWKTAHKPRTVAKDTLHSWLPAGLYVRYSLDQKRLIDTKIGAEAPPAAKTAGILIDPEAIRQLFKLVP